MPKIAFLDIDDTLISSHGECEYNSALIALLKKQKFDGIYLVTGRNPGDLMRFVRTNPQKWKKQLLPVLVAHLEAQGIKVNGVSLPFDLYLNQTQAVNAPCAVRTAGEFYTKAYARYEENAGLFGFGTRAFHNVPFHASIEKLSERMQMWLFQQNDSDKKGQFDFLMQRVFQDYPHTAAEAFQVYFWDDKPENIASADSVFKAHGILPENIGVELVQSVKDYQASTALLEKLSRKSLLTYLLTLRNSRHPELPRGARDDVTFLHKVSYSKRHGSIAEEQQYRTYLELLDELQKFSAKNCECSETKAHIKRLHDALVTIHTHFQGIPHTKKSLNDFKIQCIQAIHNTEDGLRNADDFEQIHPTLRKILGVLATITVIPALCVVWQKSTSGYLTLFFHNPREEGLRKLAAIANGFHSSLV